MSKNIDMLRKKIDEIDEKILLLLKKRIEIAKKIGEEKRKQGIPLRDSERENEKYRQITEKALKLKLNLDIIKKIYQEIISMSVQAQKE
ncbi:chorismate mutase [Candidatus Bathyarchaeota archaeon]|nr:chorismate mutase [Candidatus Bathyarchaeota archaeon]